MKQKQPLDPMYKKLGTNPTPIDMKFKDKDSLIVDLASASRRAHIKPA